MGKKKKKEDQDDDDVDDFAIDEKTGKPKSKKKHLSSKDVMARLNKVTGQTLATTDRVGGDGGVP